MLCRDDGTALSPSQAWAHKTSVLTGAQSTRGLQENIPFWILEREGGIGVMGGAAGGVSVAFEQGGGGGSDKGNRSGPTLRAQEGGLLSIGKNLRWPPCLAART